MLGGKNLFGAGIALTIGLIAGMANSAPVLYSVANDDEFLRTINPFTAATSSSIALTVIGGGTVDGGLGLATNPLTQDLFAILKVSGDRNLATINPTTGVASLIGTLSTGFAGIAFDAAGTLYGVTGDGGSPSETLFTLDPSDASETFFLTLGAGDDGETIGFNPDDGLLYHASGHDADCDGDDGVCFESIDLGLMTITDIDILGSDLEDEEAQALTYWADEGVFLWKQDHGTGPLFRVTSSGVETLVGGMDHQAKGLAFVGTATVPEPATLTLFGLGLLGLGFARRRKKPAA